MEYLSYLLLDYSNISEGAASMKIRETSRHTHVVNHVSKRELRYMPNHGRSAEFTLKVANQVTSSCSTELLRAVASGAEWETTAENRYQEQPIPLPPGKPAIDI